MALLIEAFFRPNSPWYFVCGLGELLPTNRSTFQVLICNLNDRNFGCAILLRGGHEKRETRKARNHQVGTLHGSLVEDAWILFKGAPWFLEIPVFNFPGCGCSLFGSKSPVTVANLDYTSFLVTHSLKKNLLLCTVTGWWVTRCHERWGFRFV